VAKAIQIRVRGIPYALGVEYLPELHDQLNALPSTQFSSPRLAQCLLDSIGPGGPLDNEIDVLPDEEGALTQALHNWWIQLGAALPGDLDNLRRALSAA